MTRPEPRAEGLRERLVELRLGSTYSDAQFVAGWNEALERVASEFAATPPAPAPLLGECGYNEPHEPHTYVVAHDGHPLDLECPGLPATPPAPASLDAGECVGAHGV